MISLELDLDRLSPEQSALASAAHEYYDDELLIYHGFSFHILAHVWPTARRLAEACRQNGQEIDIQVLDAACLYHDALEHRPLTSRYKTRERRAAAVCRADLRQLDLGYSPAQIKQAGDAIVTTSIGLRPTTREGAILKRADNYNVGQGLAEFLDSSVRLVREQVKLGKIGLDATMLESWREAACGILTANADACDPGIVGFELPDIDQPPEGSFLQQSRANIAHLASLTGEALCNLVQRTD